MGEGYTETAIKERLARQRTQGRPLQYHLPQKWYQLRGVIAILPKKKIKGFHALYLRYLYLLRRSRRTKLRPLPFSIRQEVVRLERYQQQFRYLLEQNITISVELEQRIVVLEWDIRTLTEERRPLYQKRRLTSDEAQKMEYSLEIDRKTASYGTTAGAGPMPQDTGGHTAGVGTGQAGTGGRTTNEKGGTAA